MEQMEARPMQKSGFMYILSRHIPDRGTETFTIRRVKTYEGREPLEGLRKEFVLVLDEGEAERHVGDLDRFEGFRDFVYGDESFPRLSTLFREHGKQATSSATEGGSC